jgi:hypothetical protein
MENVFFRRCGTIGYAEGRFWGLVLSLSLFRLSAGPRDDSVYVEDAALVLTALGIIER